MTMGNYRQGLQDTHIYIYIEERQLSSPRRAKGFQRAGLIWETIRDQMRGASIVFAQPKWWNRGRLSNYHYTSVCLYGLLLEPRMCAFLRHFPVSRESGGGSGRVGYSLCVCRRIRLLHQPLIRNARIFRGDVHSSTIWWRLSKRGNRISSCVLDGIPTHMWIKCVWGVRRWARRVIAIFRERVRCVQADCRFGLGRKCCEWIV